ncbi:uncharacterized protein BKA78DRAFT_297321 [Phyllosticta capitalensis]|uniref:uncharacterized protein n=1 Tax=Phyllosticta capitalensis TaxID=121624 RepID=UPI0031328414
MEGSKHAKKQQATSNKQQNFTNNQQFAINIVPSHRTTHARLPHTRSLSPDAASAEAPFDPFSPFLFQLCPPRPPPKEINTRGIKMVKNKSRKAPSQIYARPRPDPAQPNPAEPKPNQAMKTQREKSGSARTMEPDCSDNDEEGAATENSDKKRSEKKKTPLE